MAHQRQGGVLAEVEAETGQHWKPSPHPGLAAFGHQPHGAEDPRRPAESTAAATTSGQEYHSVRPGERTATTSMRSSGRCASSNV